MKGNTSEQSTVGSDGATPWWHGAVGYEIYVRSFADSNGDGVGDLAGITSRLDYLSWLGVDAVWLTPFYPSPGHDHGYDVSDYCAVSPHHGTLEDFDALVSEAHRRGLRVMVDIVPNHTSIEHEWFARARHDRDGPDRDRYLWADPAPDGGPPNNWLSHFGGPAWTLDEASGQYWCHLFLPEQPDLNWRNPAVRDDFDSILRWWMDRGVDGFRVDVAHGLLKDAAVRDNPQIAPIVPGHGSLRSLRRLRAPPRHGPVREHRDLPSLEPTLCSAAGDAPRRGERLVARPDVPLRCARHARSGLLPANCDPRLGTRGSPSDGAGHARRGATGNLLGAEQP